MEPLGKRERFLQGVERTYGGTKTVLIIIGKFPSILSWILKYYTLNRQFSSPLSLHPPHPQLLFTRQVPYYFYPAAMKVHPKSSQGVEILDMLMSS